MLLKDRPSSEVKKFLYETSVFHLCALGPTIFLESLIRLKKLSQMENNKAHPSH
jgi:hypothetical protein